MFECAQHCRDMAKIERKAGKMSWWMAVRPFAHEKRAELRPKDAVPSLEASKASPAELVTQLDVESTMVKEAEMVKDGT